MTKGRLLLGTAFAALAALAGTMIATDNFSHVPGGGASAQPSVAALVGAPAAPPAASAPPAQVAPAPSPSPVDERFVIRRVLPISGPIKYGEWHWDEANVPAGPIVVTVDLDARVISIFRNGYEIGASAVLLGTEEKPTPTGVFPITQKERNHTSNLYDAPMPYMQRLTNDGITLHATNVQWGYASHGCIGMPEPFAKKVFETTKVGDRVFITRGKMVGVGDSLVDS